MNYAAFRCEQEAGDEQEIRRSSKNKRNRRSGDQEKPNQKI
jgi:hypothetical protein